MLRLAGGLLIVMFKEALLPYQTKQAFIMGFYTPVIIILYYHGCFLFPGKGDNKNEY